MEKKHIEKIKIVSGLFNKLQVLLDLGIGYLTLGEATPALSGGEAQRLKLASEIGKIQDGSVFIFDEPSIGLHPKDVKTLLNIFQKLIDNGATIVVIEHDLDVIKNSDYIIDMGPEGGYLGGKVVGTGTVQDIKENKKSITGRYLQKHFPFNMTKNSERRSLYMNIAIIYSSITGNTRIIAETIKESLQKENIVYFGNPTEDLPEADIYIIGSWTDKGNPTDEIINVLKKIKSKKIAYFGTAGFGGSEEYFKKLFERVKINIDSSNKILGYFYCQGKMPMQVKTRYEKMLEENPGDSRLKLSIENFDRALSHPNDEDINNVKNWVDTKILNN